MVFQAAVGIAESLPGSPGSKGGSTEDANAGGCLVLCAGCIRVQVVCGEANSDVRPWQYLTKKRTSPIKNYNKALWKPSGYKKGPQDHI